MAYDKAKWHYEAGNFPKEMNIEQGGVHMAFFYRWVIENNFIGEDLLEDMQEEVDLIKTGKYSALDLLFDIDGCLTDEEFNEAGNAFASQYYEPQTEFSKKYSFYLEDYGTLNLEHFKGIEESEYGIIYSDTNYQKVKAIMDQRYQEFLNVKLT